MTEHDHTHQAANALRRTRHMTPNRSTIIRILATALGVTLGLTVAAVVHAGRNSTGTYSLPAGTTVAGGTTITSAWANNFTGDVSTELTASLDRNGRGGMLAPLKCVDGTAGAPGLTFGNEPGTGLYRIGTSNPALTVSGVKRQEWTSTGSKIVGEVAASNGALLTGGNITMSQASDQGINKEAGALVIGTTDVHNLVLRTNNASRWVINPVDGNMTSQGGTVTGLPIPVGSYDAATKGYVDTADALKAPLASPTFTGTVTLPNTGSGANEAATKGYVDAVAASLPSQAYVDGRNVVARGLIDGAGALVSGGRGVSGGSWLNGSCTVSFSSPQPDALYTVLVQNGSSAMTRQFQSSSLGTSSFKVDVYDMTGTQIMGGSAAFKFVVIR